MKTLSKIKLLFAVGVLFILSGAFMLAAPGTGTAAEQSVSVSSQAAVRTEAPTGIRFYGQVTDQCYEQDPFELGVRIKFTDGEQQITAERAVDKNTLYQKEGVWTYNVVIANIPETAYNTDFSVEAYVIEEEGGEKIYSESSVAHSLAYIAGLAEKDNPTENSFYDGIIDKAAENFALTETSINLKAGETHDITYTGTKVTYVTYSSEDDQIASVDDNGKVTAVAEGETVIRVSIGSNTRELTVNVTPDTVALGVFDAELSLSGENIVQDSALAPESLKEYLAGASDITQSMGGSSESVTYSSETGILSGLKAGESILSFTAGGQKYSAELNVCTLIINDKSDLKLMTTVLEANKVRTGGDSKGVIPTFTSGGYFVLGADIAFDPDDPAFQSDFKLYYKAYYDYADNGFTGTFDGRGHTISDIKISSLSSTDDVTEQPLRSVGLFTYLDETAVVKNLGITGYSNTNEPYGSFLASVIEGTVSNIHIVHQGKFSSSGNYIQNTGILSQTIKAGAKLENIILFIEEDTVFSGSECGLLTSRMEVADVSGVYVISDGMAQRKDGSNYYDMPWCMISDQNDRMMQALENGEGAFYASLADFTSGNATDLSKEPFTEGTHDARAYIDAHFSTDIWDLSDTDGLPTLKPQV